MQRSGVALQSRSPCARTRIAVKRAWTLSTEVYVSLVLRSTLAAYQGLTYSCPCFPHEQEVRPRFHTRLHGRETGAMRPSRPLRELHFLCGAGAGVATQGRTADREGQRGSHSPRFIVDNAAVVFNREGIVHCWMEAMTLVTQCPGTRQVRTVLTVGSRTAATCRYDCES